ncbi:S-adenosyl-L-methionine-dependent methyltransferase [Paramyrothecium foliicola]|nr:S-adenosyl-L-methionine-dependent methyltransferase [Paramyrothecium foliicola]
MEWFQIEQHTRKLEQMMVEADEDVRRRAKMALTTLMRNLDDSNDTVHWLGYSHLKPAAVRIGFNLGLFRWLSAVEGDVSLEDVVKQTKAEPVFLDRFLRYLSSIDVVKETSKGRYEATNTTRNLATEVAESGISHCFETVGPLYQNLPSYFLANTYQNPQSPTTTVFQQAFETSDPCFRYLGAKRHDLLDIFNKYMEKRRDAEISWLSVYPVAKHLVGDGVRERIAFVDVGGGVGHQCNYLLEKFPKLSGRVVLQDLPHTIKKVEDKNTPGVKKMSHDFFEKQPVSGAKFYYLRGVCHNHPDHKVKLLLGRLRDAMAEDSILILDEWVLPDLGVNSYAASMDLVMMAACAGGERTDAQWHEILEETALKLEKKYVYNKVNYESVLEVRKK